MGAYRLNFDLDDLLGVFLVVQTVSKKVAKIPESTLYAICDGFFLALHQSEFLHR
jgi:hypothetical protein